ncbi:MAG: DNA polymerase III subunit beta [SAR86 cluster bacterium]|uniref:Beta sliding clamp n=1 Tax=SAR86 cluster bacterium TaxID=2030880 RepID=A0A2A4MT78_9GAMM|nr:MAG: DNA polymerase III subunit beta [SAR86 cluster bacterium]
MTFTDQTGGTIRDFNPSEFALDVAYARKLSDNFSVGLAARYVNSNLTGGTSVQGANTKAGQSVAADISAYYQSNEFEIKQNTLRDLIDKTAFAMAQQDVRYYLNGMLFETNNDEFKTVATDGHRLAVSSRKINAQLPSKQVIVPRKGVMELLRLIEATDDPVTVQIGDSHLRANINNAVFTTKLVDGRFPDYQRVLPRNGDKEIITSRVDLKQALARASILSNEKFRGVRFNFTTNELKITANNPEQEEAEETVSVDYSGEELEMGFNVSYLIDVFSVLNSQSVRLTLLDANSSALVESAEGGGALYVVMPMRL